MRKKLIYICSPCRGDVEKNIRKAQEYCREAVQLFPDVIPIAPHVYFTQFLNELEPAERVEGMEMGIALLDMCSEIWVYGMENPSEGMKAEIRHAHENGITIRDAADVYKATELPEEALGDALLVLPSHTGTLSGVAAIESTTVRISGEVIVELAQELKRNRGKDLTVEATS